MILYLHVGRALKNDVGGGFNNGCDIQTCTYVASSDNITTLHCTALSLAGPWRRGARGGGRGGRSGRRGGWRHTGGLRGTEHARESQMRLIIHLMVSLALNGLVYGRAVSVKPPIANDLLSVGCPPLFLTGDPPVRDLVLA
ncbi:hypothetical protein JYU34_013208 [Plutella xylostella]|uniref:Uncharacterized protein n=1 Tax=Plutella xylostella TaxID=51655 RepID=A0ABQ7QCZ0_PLUXY|nr:hypothetical protein JYU34_013208 [Plutella xylostella]